ncbi:glycosyltransferase [uncultured Brevibacillus sp.]|uniref:glycosyltransferase n=1 Tax=uncultured Brevibacillus sp. TaxID=169970 RepID=UPI0025960002|nr:glycosyltransferase [uncultured Brevibacillus sp.]
MPERKRVALIVPNLTGGGAERVVVHLLRHLNRVRIEPILIVVDLFGPYVSKLPPDIQIVNLQSKRVRYALPKLIREINRLKPDAIMSTLDYMNLALLGVKPFLVGSPRLIVREANTPSKSIQTLSSFGQKCFTWLYRLLYKRSDVIVTQSDGMRQDLLAFLPGLDPSKVVRIYNPLDVETVKREASLFHPFSHDGKKLVIVAAGRLTYQKGFDLLLQAFGKVRSVHENAQLYILGEGPLLVELTQLAEELGITDYVTFAGFQKNPYPYLKHADLFVLSSRWEGFPNILLEAIASGSRVVATRCPSGPDEILEEGRYGVLVKSDCVDSLADGMLTALNKETVFDSGMQKARQYSAPYIAGLYEQIFTNENERRDIQEGLA